MLALVRDLTRALAAEHQLRQLLHHGDLPQPDEVEYRETEVVFLWNEEKAAVVIELEDGSVRSEPSRNGGER
jgi:hypothetical protein